MIDSEVRDSYKVTIGIECHVQLKTKTKLFSAIANDAREAPPNSLVSHIDFGLPGALPVLNQAALGLACRAAFALNTRPQSFSKFDRKHYFYPDLPMGYQITQYEEPIILGGQVEIEIDRQLKPIGITRAHLEADAGKSVHPPGKDYSLIDLNRAGTPLLEIVSEPDMHSSLEAKTYARELYLLMRYADVSDANLYYGNMRFDVNVSVSKTEDLGVRSETKNLNSFRSVEKAVDYEVNRQIERLEKGEKIVQETRGWDEAKQKTFSQRTKEDADDYRYMPDPDLPPIKLSDDYIYKIESEMPPMPSSWRASLSGLGLDRSQVETLIEAEVEPAQQPSLVLIEKLLDQPDLAKALANWLINVEIPLRRSEDKLAELKPDQRSQLYQKLYQLIQAGHLSSTNAKALIEDVLKTGDLKLEELASTKGYIQVSDEAEIAKLVADVLAANPKAADDVRSGQMKAIGFLVGQVMANSQGKANPSLAQKLIKQQLGL